MVGVELKGRLGNQLFHYAYARYVIYKRQTNDSLIFGSFSFRHKSPEDGWKNCLGDFNILDFKECKGMLVFKMGSAIVKFLYILYLIDLHYLSRNTFLAQKRWKKVLNKYGVILSSIKNIKNNIDIPQTKNVFIDGNFENPILFNEIKELLKEELTPRYKPLIVNKDLYNVIENSNSVCVTVRRGDYLEKGIKERFYVCDNSYYINAIKIMSEKILNPVFVFFSDDIEWVKDNIKVNYPCYYESGKDPLWEKIRLMYSCKHFVISNSTFSWWAQYLCRNEHKLVVSPSTWYNDGSHSFLINDSFIKIDTKKKGIQEDG